MLFHQKVGDRTESLQTQLRLASAVTPGLFSSVVKEASERFAALYRAHSSARIDRLVEAGAWTDAALALIELELPAWKLRRLAYEDGEWHCSLSKQRDLPDWLDDAVETHHEALPLALLSALVEARCADAASKVAVRTVPASGSARTAAVNAICCENFS